MEDQPRQQRQAAATQELRDLSSSTRGPSTTQVLRVLMLVLLSGVLLLLAGLSLAGTLIGLAVTAPLFVLFSPVLIASALTIGLVVTGFLMSAAFVLMALFFFMRMNSLWTRMGEQCTISGGERRDSGPSASVDNGNGKSVVAVDQQQLVIGNNYYVFLSFRGPDTRKGFADHLYHKLKDVGLRFHPNFVFRDNEDLPFGEDLGANLISAIMHSKVSIPIISKNYANSEWCLRELIGIMECKESRGQIVLPVLYKVETKDVRYLKGSVKHAFESRKYWSDEAVKQRGKEALSKAAECRVYESENFADGHEAELVDELVATVMRKQQEDFQPYLHENLVGNDDDVVEVMRLVDTACPNTRIIGIYGISGIGKTTLATIVYEKLFDKFDCRSFLRDVGEKLKSNGIEHVQSQLISDILNKPKYKVLDSNEGIKMIQTNCAEKKVLILLDDVNHQDHLNKLIGNGKFMRGSRIIITCRDEATLKSEYHKYKCRELNFNNSLRLFNIHAFEGKPPPMELASLSSEIVATTGGLPLALIVIGSLLKRTKDPKAWEEYRDKWTKEPQREVIDRLKISYDALEEGTKQMFQDITCFFIGTDHRIATYLWSDLQLYPRSGLQKMMELSLIKYDDNKLRMHDQLRDLGRCMARPANKKHWDYKRLWDEEAMKVLGREHAISIFLVKATSNLGL
ncbi:disease resistance protein RUN1-like [Eucalyptus grandis]|uniref:disease resistance protein RUN1-like n=1 Tax=Eucalyptus grandis TaxID=71139 RepID=UPI00192F01C6|nr:disease resistance protein RUN1-like [Eucalyptus grandis]